MAKSSLQQMDTARKARESEMQQLFKELPACDQDLLLRTAQRANKVLSEIQQWLDEGCDPFEMTKSLYIERGWTGKDLEGVLESGKERLEQRVSFLVQKEESS